MSLVKYQIGIQKSKKFIPMNNRDQISILYYLALCLSVFCFVLFLISNGGLSAIILKWGYNNRADLVTGNIFTQLMFALNPILAGLNQYMYSIKKIRRYQMILMIVYLALLSMMDGSRGGTLAIVVISIISYSYVNQTVKLNYFIKHSWILILLVPFFILMPNLRMGKVGDNFLNNPISILTPETSVFEDNLSKWKDLSRADIQIFIIDHFSNKDFWYGNSFKNILFGLIPKKFYPNKPAIDDGRYICSLSMGFDVNPNAPSDQVEAYTAWPSRTIGTWYANFGIIGVILAAFIIGKIYIFFYQNIYTNNILYILLYPIVLFSLNLSVLGIVNFFILIITISMLMFISRIIISLKKR